MKLRVVLLLRVTLALLVSYGARVESRGLYWDAVGHIRTNYSQYERWDRMELSLWAPDHSRVTTNESEVLLLMDLCTCLSACTQQLSCFSASVRKLPDETVRCILSDVRGSPTSNIADDSGYQIYQRAGVARLHDHCSSDSECQSSDSMSHCVSQQCLCHSTTVEAQGSCHVSCSKSWYKVVLSDRIMCYYISKQRVKAQDIAAECASKQVEGSVIADIKDEEEQSNIRALLTRHYTWSDRIMFGLGDLGGEYTYAGRDDWEGTEANFFSWGGKEPNNPKEHCTVMFKGYDWNWADVDCEVFDYYYICEVEVVPHPNSTDY